MLGLAVFFVTALSCSAYVCNSAGLCNVAHGGYASSNDARFGGAAPLAIDGNRDGVFNHRSCTFSGKKTGNWWSVQLTHSFVGLTVPIDHVVIYNRVDRFQERIDGAKVYVKTADSQSKTMCGTVNYVKGQSVYNVNCSQAEGNEVLIEKDKNILTLCEVEVMVSSGEQNARVPYINLALNSTAVQSSQYKDAAPSRAIDGSRSGNMARGSCSRTEARTPTNSWSLSLPGGELGVKYPVKSVLIFNRKDCCGARIDGVEVWVDGEMCGKVSHVEGVFMYKIPCNREGGRVTLVNRKTHLTLCEVEVYVEEKYTNPPRVVNVAPAGRAYQTNTRYGGEADRAIDNQTTTRFSADSCTMTSFGTRRKWTVELAGVEVGVKYPVERVIVYNRNDKPERINLAKVWVDNEMCGQITYKEDKNVYMIECGGRAGSRVSLSLDEGTLTICEVLVIVKSSNLPKIPSYTNAALQRNATEGHNTAANAARAVDGNTSGRGRDNSCSFSKDAQGGGTWWKVELDDVSPVQSVVVYNRADTFLDRIDGVQVYVDKHQCGRVEYEEKRQVYSVQCAGAEGREVTLKKDGDGVLALCEVQVLVIEEEGTEVIDEEI